MSEKTEIAMPPTRPPAMPGKSCGLIASITDRWLTAASAAGADNPT